MKTSLQNGCWYLALRCWEGIKNHCRFGAKRKCLWGSCFCTSRGSLWWILLCCSIKRSTWLHPYGVMPGNTDPYLQGLRRSCRRMSSHSRLSFSICFAALDGTPTIPNNHILQSVPDSHCSLRLALTLGSSALHYPNVRMKGCITTVFLHFPQLQWQLCLTSLTLMTQVNWPSVTLWSLFRTLGMGPSCKGLPLGFSVFRPHHHGE